MNNDELKRKLIEALMKLYGKDYPLVKRRCSERSIVFRLGLYLAKQFENEEYHVDCEYNKNGEKPKSLMGKTFNYPDIIVHKRESNEANLMLIEVKTPNDSKREHLKNDIKKLKGFTSEIQYSYQLGVHIYISKTKCIVVYYINGGRLEYKEYTLDDLNVATSQRSRNSVSGKKTNFEKLYEEVEGINQF